MWFATAWSLDKPPARDLAVVNQGVLQPNANRVLMAVGTGLGEAFLSGMAGKYRVFPSEGGLADFSPRTDREIRLLIHLNQILPHVCCEDILSGTRNPRDPRIPGSSGPTCLVRRRGRGCGCRPARSANWHPRSPVPYVLRRFDLWTEAYGSEAGNVALRALRWAGCTSRAELPRRLWIKSRTAFSFARFAIRTKLLRSWRASRSMSSSTKTRRSGEPPTRRWPPPTPDNFHIPGAGHARRVLVIA